MLFRFLIRQLFFLKNSHESTKKDEEDKVSEEKKEEELKLTTNMLDNINKLENILKNCTDLRMHQFSFGKDNAINAVIFYFDGMVNFQTSIDSILRPLKDWKGDFTLTQKSKNKKNTENISKENLLNSIKNDAILSPDTKDTNTVSDLIEYLFVGDTVLLINGLEIGFALGTQGWEKRPVEEPLSEVVVRGPREGFTESYKVNTSLLRRKIRNEKLKIEEIIVGRKTKTKIAIVYLEGVADPTVLKKVRYRIGEIKVDSILESSYIEQYIEDAPFSIFPTIGYTEKPDVAAGKILEGRIAIIVDGSPIVLTIPYLFIESMQSSEDYYNRWIYASMTRILRIVGYVVAVFAPAFYIALTTFHHELIPTKLLLTIANSRAGTPFPVFIEALIMIFAFELLREAGIRLPRAVGQAITIVGALIMGDAAVNAGIVGATMVVVVAGTAVAGFMIPTQTEAISILRLLMIFLAAFTGFYGIAMGILLLLAHLASLNSFGVPYLDHITSFKMQDIFMRPPHWAMQKRPEDIARGDMTRREFFIPPKRPETEEEKEKVDKNQGKTKQQLEEE